MDGELIRACLGYDHLEQSRYTKDRLGLLVKITKPVVERRLPKFVRHRTVAGARVGQRSSLRRRVLLRERM